MMRGRGTRLLDPGAVGFVDGWGVRGSGVAGGAGGSI